MNHFGNLALYVPDARLKRRSRPKASVKEDVRMISAAVTDTNLLDEEDEDWNLVRAVGLDNAERVCAKDRLKEFNDN